MDKISELLITLARESEGGKSLETLEPQGIAAVVLLLKDGQVALINPEGSAAYD